MSFIPFPTLDLSRCYGSKDCEECKGLCPGHYLKLDDLWEHVSNGGKMPSEPLSEVLLKELNHHHVIPDDRRLRDIAKEVLLSVDESKMCFDHLNSVHENRTKGAARSCEGQKF